MTPPPDLASTDGDEAKQLLATIAQDYVTAVRGMTARDLRAYQHPPYASLAFGAAGIAYMLWRHDEHDPAAIRWLTAARRFSADDAWMTPAYPSTLEDRRQSLATGPPGLAWVRLLVATSTGERRSADHWSRVLSQDVDHVRHSEMLLGRAGHLLGLVVAADRAAAGRLGSLPRVERAIDRLTDRLATDIASKSTHDQIAFARGRLGVHHALLVSRRRRREVPDDRELRLLQRLGERVPDMRDLGEPLWRSWCNGTTGAVLTWVEAFRATGDRAWLDLARRDGATLRQPVDPGDDPGTLCCGSGGWAQACLALDGVLPGEGWRDHALTLAVRSFDNLDSPWQHGLLRGYPGLVCLALDLTSDDPRGFPLVAA